MNKIYYRIWRPTTGNPGYYIYEQEYADDRAGLTMSYRLIEDDMREIFRYVEPRPDIWSGVYSHKIYELFLRICTEFEQSCKKILAANEFTSTDRNGGVRSPNQWNIQDYRMVEQATRLSEYRVDFHYPNADVQTIQPFERWVESGRPAWYSDYNVVKHNREAEFPKANLKNCIDAAAGLLVVLFAQFFQFLEPYHTREQAMKVNTRTGIEPFGVSFIEDSIFSLRPPLWEEVDQYRIQNPTTPPFSYEKFNFGTVSR